MQWQKVRNFLRVVLRNTRILLPEEIYTEAVSHVALIFNKIHMHISFTAFHLLVSENFPRLNVLGPMEVGVLHRPKVEAPWLDLMVVTFVQVMCFSSIFNGGYPNAIVD